MGKDQVRCVLGDILNIREGIIVHQVNCRRVMGAGLAKKIRELYPEHYVDFMNTTPALGKVFTTKVEEGLYIAGIYGQDRYGRSGCYTDYDALRRGLKRIQVIAQQLELDVYIPYGIGCGLAGGDWKTVCKIIEEELPSATIVRKEAT